MSCFGKNHEIASVDLHNWLNYDRSSGIFTWKVCRGGSVPGDIAGQVQNNGYRVVCINYTKYLAHRLAWFYVTGTWPKAEIDHRDGNRDNNSFTNLREATRKQNSCNRGRRCDNTSGVPGVSWRESRGKWRAYIQVENSSIHLGYFPTMGAAIDARRAAEVMYFGNFVRKDCR